MIWSIRTYFTRQAFELFVWLSQLRAVCQSTLPHSLRSETYVKVSPIWEERYVKVSPNCNKFDGGGVLTVPTPPVFVYYSDFVFAKDGSALAIGSIATTKCIVISVPFILLAARDDAVDVACLESRMDGNGCDVLFHWSSSILLREWWYREAWCYLGLYLWEPCFVTCLSPIDWGWFGLDRFV